MKIVNKAYSFLGIIKINSTCLSKEAFIALYNSCKKISYGRIYYITGYTPVHKF